jgi:uncharacterized protein YjeT (DUF2065 family)
MTTLLVAVALCLVFEGLFPLLMPALWRQKIAAIAALANGQLRFIGLLLVALGAAILAFVAA